jgi:hypothetical protein
MHIAVGDTPPTFLLPLLNRLRRSSSAALQNRLAAWSQSQLRSRGISFDERVKLVMLANRRLDSRLAELADEFENAKDQIEVCASRGATFPLRNSRLDLELLLDVHAFVSHLRSAGQLLDRFLFDFFRIILERPIRGQKTYSRLLEAHGIKDSCSRLLTAFRDDVTHEITPLLGVEIDPDNPQSFDLLLLPPAPPPGGWFRKKTALSQLRNAWDEYRSNLPLIALWLEQEIRDFEAGEAGLPATSG